MFSASSRLAQFIPSIQTRRGDFALDASALQKAKEIVGEERIVGNHKVALMYDASGQPFLRITPIKQQRPKADRPRSTEQAKALPVHPNPYEEYETKSLAEIAVAEKMTVLKERLNRTCRSYGDRGRRKRATLSDYRAATCGRC